MEKRIELVQKLVGIGDLLNQLQEKAVSHEEFEANSLLLRQQRSKLTDELLGISKAARRSNRARCECWMDSLSIGWLPN